MWVVEPLQADAAAPPGGSGAYYVLLSSEALDGTTHSLGRPPKKNKAGEPMGEVASDLVVEGDTSLSKEHLRFLLSASEAPGQPLRMFVTDLSRFGTAVNGERLVKGQQRELASGDLLRLSTHGIITLRVRQAPLRLLWSSGLPARSDSDQLHARLAGASYVHSLAGPAGSEAGGVTHVVVAEGGQVTAEVLWALLAGKPLVTPAWLAAVAAQPRWGAEALPAEQQHEPAQLRLPGAKQGQASAQPLSALTALLPGVRSAVRGMRLCFVEDEQGSMGASGALRLAAHLVGAVVTSASAAGQPPDGPPSMVLVAPDSQLPQLGSYAPHLRRIGLQALLAALLAGDVASALLPAPGRPAATAGEPVDDQEMSEDITEEAEYVEEVGQEHGNAAPGGPSHPAAAAAGTSGQPAAAVVGGKRGREEEARPTTLPGSISRDLQARVADDQAKRQRLDEQTWQSILPAGQKGGVAAGKRTGASAAQASAAGGRTAAQQAKPADEEMERDAGVLFAPLVVNSGPGSRAGAAGRRPASGEQQQQPNFKAFKKRGGGAGGSAAAAGSRAQPVPTIITDAFRGSADAAEAALRDEQARRAAKRKDTEAFVREATTGGAAKKRGR